MAEEVSSIGVKLSLNAGSFMTGMTAATEKTEAFVAVAKEAQTVAGRGAGSSGPSSQRAQRPVAVPVDLTVSAAQISRIRKQIIAGIGTIEVPITVQMSKQIQSEAKAIMAAASTPAVGTRSGARVAVESTVARNLPKRAMGGPVYANQGYLVGERRPEVFTPRVSGTIHPDASRFYREEEARARRAASAERQHMDRMRHMGGPVYASGGVKVGDIEERLTRLQRSYTANIRAASKRLTPEVTKAGVEWYPQAEQWIAEQAKKFGKPEPMVRGMAAALSAGTSWSANKTKLERMLEWDSKGQPQRYSDALDAHRKAKKILAGADPWGILGHTPKTGQFFLNTGGDLDALTIDRWAFRTATRGAVDNQGSGKVRRGADRAFRRVAKEMNIAPVQLQAALWIQEKYDADVAAGRHADISKYMHRGGMVHAAKGFFMAGNEAIGTKYNSIDPSLIRKYTPKGGTERLVYRGLERGKKMTPEEAIAQIEAHNAGLAAGTGGHRDPKEIYTATSGDAAVDARARELLDWLVARPEHQPGKGSPRGSDVLKAIKRGTGPLDPTYDAARKRNWGPLEEKLFDNARRSLAGQKLDAPYNEFGLDPTTIQMHGESRARIIGRLEALGDKRTPLQDATLTAQKETFALAEQRAAEEEYALANGASPADIRRHRLGKGTTGHPLGGLESRRVGVPRMESMLYGHGWRTANASRFRASAYAAQREAAFAGEDLGGPSPSSAGTPNPYEKSYTEWKAKRESKGHVGYPGWFLATRTAGGPYEAGDFENRGSEAMARRRPEGPFLPPEATGTGRYQHVLGSYDDYFDSREEAEAEGIRRFGAEHGVGLKAVKAKKETAPHEAIEAARVAARHADVDRGYMVPKHEAPPVIEHMAVIERHAKKAVEAHAEKVAEAAIASVVQTADSSGRIIGPSLFETTPRPAGGKSMSPSEADAKLRALGLHRRGAGGGVNGMYVVNEMGPEAFIESGDVSKLAANRPDIYSRIPGSHDGMRSGMINRPAWSMFAPHKSGVIVRREDAHAALGAIHAAGGLILPGEEDEARRAAARAAAYGTPPELYLPKGPSYSAATPVSRGVRGEGMEAFVAAIKADTAAIMAHAEMAKKGTTLLGTGTEHIAGLLEAGPTAIPLGGPSATPTGLGPIALFGPGGPGAAAATAAARPIAASAAATTKAATKAADVWVSIGKGLEAKPEYAKDLKSMIASGATRKDIMSSLIGGMGGVRKAEGGAELGAPSGRTALEREALKFGYVSEKHARLRAGGATDVEERLGELRQSTAGAAAFETARTPRGAAAVLSQLLAGGGLEFKRRQQELATSTQAFRQQGRVVIGLEKETEARRQAIGYLEKHGATEEETSALTEELTQHEDTLKEARAELTERTKRLDRAEQAVLPTTGNVLKSFSSIIAGTTLYGAAFSAVSLVIDKAAIPALGRWADEISGWAATSTKVTTALGEQLSATHGNIDATMAQAGVTAGLSKSMLDYVGAATLASASAKAGAKAQQATSELFHAAEHGGPPEGLYGGYGGILGSPLLGSEMGGGVGFTEQIAKDVNAMAGGTGINIPGLGSPESFPKKIEQGMQFLSSREYRNYVLDAGKQQGSPLGDIGAGAGAVGDVLRGVSSGLGGLHIDPMVGAALAGAVPGGSSIAGFLGQFGPGGFGQAAPPPPAGFKPGQYVPPAIGTGSAPEKQAIGQYLGDLNESISRGASAASHGVTAYYRLAANQDEVNKATLAAVAAGDDYGVQLAQQGVVLKTNTGQVIDNGKAYQQATEDAARGKTIIPSAVWAGLQTRALQAGQSANAIQSQRTRDVELPFAVTEQLLSNPLIRPGAGFFNARGGAGGVGLSAGAQRAAGGLLRGTAADNAALTAISDQGLAAARKDVTQFLTPQDLTTFNQAVTESQSLSASIADITTKMAHMNQEAAKASWANQIRIATRALGDAIAMEGKAGGTRLGYLQREQHQIDRASQALNLELQQRQITTQIALAGFQAPGETGEERYARQKEKLAEAAIAQKQLGFQKQDYSVAGQEWMIAAHRAAVDAQHAIDVMQKSRDAEGYTAAAQEAIAKKQQLLANSVGKIDSLVAQARGNFNAALSAAVNGVGEFAGSVEQATKDIYGALGYKKDRQGNYYRAGTPGVPSSTGYMGRKAGGYLGGFAGGATFTVGEAGPETVAILRNPRTHMLGGESGGGSPTIHVHVNGPIVREDKDIAELARCVAEEVERTLSRKGQLLGLRQPAY